MLDSPRHPSSQAGKGPGTRIVMKEEPRPRFELVPAIYGGMLCLTAVVLLLVVAQPMRDPPPPREAMRGTIEPEAAPPFAAELGQVRSRLAAIERDSSPLVGRMARLEAALGDITGSISPKREEPAEPLGIDLGPHKTLAAMRGRVAELRKAAPALASLTARAAAVDAGKDGVELHLTVGPFTSTRQLIAACGQLRALGQQSCAAVAFDGQPVDAP